MVVFKVLLHGTAILNFFLIIVIAAEDVKTTTEIPISEFVFWNQISDLERNRLVKEMLIQDGYQLDMNETSTYNLSTEVIHYLTHQIYNKNEENITNLARLLLKPLGAYGAEPGEEISQDQKISAIHDWLKRLILNMSFEEWILNEVRKIKIKEDNSSLTHQNLRQLFFQHLLDKVYYGEISGVVRIYYITELLKDDMPSFVLNPIDEQELERLQLMKLDEPDFGYLHAGLKALSTVSHFDLCKNQSLDDIKEIGIFFESLIQEGNITNVQFFELPAKVYVISVLDVHAPTKLTGSFFYLKYFEYLKNSNVFIKLLEPLNNWKTRSQLAKQTLNEIDVHENYLDHYLTNGDSSENLYDNKDEKVLLPDIDYIFEEQNRNVQSSFRKLDMLMLSQVFYVLNKEDQDFIQAAEVTIVKAVLRTEFSFGKILLLRARDMDSRSRSIFPMFLEANNIDLLNIEMNGKQRLYVLDTHKYKLNHVQPNSQTLCEIFTCNHPFEEYRVDLEFQKQVKEKDTSLEILVNNLSDLHAKKLYENLKTIGYEPTGWQKFKDFMLSLIPFYTCVNELKDGNFGDAILPCTLDIASFIPFIGQALKAAYEFASTSTRVLIHALTLSAKQATIHQILRQAGKSFTKNGISQIQKTISPKVFQSLGAEFLRSADPGFGLLRLGGVKAVKTLKKASGYLEKEFFNLKKFAEKFVNQGEKELTRTSFISADLLKTKKMVKLPYIKEETAVVKVGTTKNGNDILVRIDEDDKILYGRKYISNGETGKIDLAPISVREKIFKIQSEGLSGRGAVAAAKQWNKWEEHSVSLSTSIRVGEVFRADTRNPELLIHGEGGIWPRPGPHDYNLDMHHFFYENYGEYLGETSPFVSTTGSLSVARTHAKYYADIEDAINYQKTGIQQSKNPDDIIGYITLIRPDSNFYNMGESYKAARDVCHPGSSRYEQIDDIYNNWSGMHEYVALGGVDKERIMAYAPIRRSDDGQSPLQWVLNPVYNRKFDTDLSAEDLYTRVATYRADHAMDMAINIVQQVRNVNKNHAKILIKCSLNEKKILELVTKFNTHKEEQLGIIRDLTCAL